MKTIVETAIENGNFKTLVTAVQEAGLVDTLSGNGPFTVFAPTDEAFAKVPKETLNALLANKEELAKVLTYHVLPGKVPSSAVSNKKHVKTVEGSDVCFYTKEGVKVDDANVLMADIHCSNGVIHVIDQVILPGRNTGIIFKC